MRKTLFVTLAFCLLSLILFESLALSFEDTRVMPKGIRRVEYRNISTSLSKKTNEQGLAQDLANPLRADLKVKNMVKKRNGFEKTQLLGFLQTRGLNEEDSLGQFTADLQGQINVQALTFAYGLSDRLTLGFALPFYSAQTSAKVGFRQNENAEGIVEALYAQGTINKSREAATQLNAAASSFNETLETNGYESIGDWQEEGMGDTIIRGKYLVGDYGWLRTAGVFGLTLPTGRVDNPNILTDIPFGDGTFDQTVGVALDQPVRNSIVFNQYAYFTHQSAARREVRLVTDAEPVEGDVKEVGYKLGDKYEIGASMRYTHAASGINAGLGYQFHKKLGDKYFEAGASGEKLGRNTNQTWKLGEMVLGYSGIEAFRSGKIPVPFTVNVLYQRQLNGLMSYDIGGVRQIQHRFDSINTPVTHLFQVDAAMFF